MRNLDRLRPLLKNRVEMKVALHRHPGVAGVMEAAEELLRAVPGIEIVKLDVPAVGLQSVNLATLPAFKKELQLKELEAARAAGVDALVAVYHSDHRELCAHERDWPFKIINVLEIVGESMGFRQEDHYKNLKIKQDVDAIVADSRRPDEAPRRRSRHRAPGDRQRHARRPAAAAPGRAGAGRSALNSPEGPLNVIPGREPKARLHASSTRYGSRTRNPDRYAQSVSGFRVRRLRAVPE